ncbi:MAG: aldehyde ferredoxin oxidoreductase family protein [Anaerolineaceae bacterium]|nr:aldehyde ferredoxin oxidoreductase family protein [Anaerolineaceae bacterium]
MPPFGRLLKVNLSGGQISQETIPEEFTLGFIGASGLAVRLLWDALDPSIDPLAPENPMLWITGPLTGSAGPTTGRFTICARSPQTGLWGESNIGGFVGPELRFAGFDAVWLCGRAPQPVYLWIHNGQAELRSAAGLWGKTDTYETQRLIKGELNEPHARVACIGLAGENCLPIASILSDHGRLAARTGMGALMGSKNLKALAVRGSTGAQSLPLARPDEYRRLRVESNKALIEQNMTAVMRETGTSGAADYLQVLGDMPQKYWTQAAFEGAEKVSGAEMAQTILTGRSACQGCVISCGREVTVKEGSYATQGQVKGPEYETICAFGPQLLVDDLPTITALGNLCDRFGMDTISAGSVIALAYLLFERGLISEVDTGGLSLHWGDASPCFPLLDLLARREGFGALLALGSRDFATRYGVPELAAQVNNLDLAMHDPRSFTGQALAYVTSPRGACHNQSDYFQVELGGSLEELGIPMTERDSEAGKAAYVARHQHWRTVCNSLVVCFFAVVPPQTLVDLLAAATGHAWDVEELMMAGERAWNLKRAYNCRLGLTRATEKLPRILLEPLPDGGQGGHVPDMDLLLKEYYLASGWDPASGYPLPEKLESLGLGFARRAV